MEPQKFIVEFVAAGVCEAHRAKPSATEDPAEAGILNSGGLGEGAQGYRGNEEET